MWNIKNTFAVNTQSIIKDILITKNKVTIIGLGSFLGTEQPATIDEKTGTIYPPSKKITFDTSQKEDDGVLMKKLLSYGLSEEEVSKEIYLFTKTINNKLKKEGKFEFPQLGYLSKDENSNITFTQTTTESLLPDNTGLGTLSFNPDSLKSMGNNISGSSKQKQDYVPNKKKTKKFKTIIFILIPLIIILALLGIFHKKIFSKVEQLFGKTADTVQTVVSEKPIIVDSVQKEETVPINSDEFGNDEEYRKLLDAKISNTANVNLGTGFKKFYIIMGSFEYEQNATKLKNELIRTYSNVETIHKDNLYRVSVGGYDTADELIKNYSNLQNKYGNAVWILINK